MREEAPGERVLYEGESHGDDIGRREEEGGAIKVGRGVAQDEEDFEGMVEEEGDEEKENGENEGGGQVHRRGTGRRVSGREVRKTAGMSAHYCRLGSWNENVFNE